MEGWPHALREVATLAPGARGLDVACGTGVVTRQAARRAGFVVSEPCIFRALAHCGMYRKHRPLQNSNAPAPHTV
jgi:hypothetical protein